MKKVVVLNNENKICTETISEIICVKECHEFSLRTVFNGNELYNIRHRELNVFPGCFLMIKEGTPYDRSVNSSLPVDTFSIFFSNRFLNSFHRGITSSDHVLLDEPFTIADEIVPRFIETLYPLKGDMSFNLVHIRSLFQSAVCDDMLMNEYLFHCLLNFYRIYYREILAKSERLNVVKTGTRIELFRRLNNAKDYLISNYNKDIQLEDICRNACLSETHLHRYFKQVFYCSPHQYLIKLRLSQARQMLKSSNFKIKEIVNFIGFDCMSSFIRLFKDRYGLTPGNYRLVTTA